MAVGSSPACPAHSSPIFCASSSSSSWEPCWVSRSVWASCWRAEPHRCPRMSCQSLTPRTAWSCASSSSSPSPRKTQERPGNVGVLSQGSNVEIQFMEGEFLLSFHYFIVLY